MGDPCPYPPPREQGSAVLTSAVAGAVLGAAGLAWWLLSEAERRRLQSRRQRLLAGARLQDDSEGNEADPAPSPSLRQRDLHDKVHELNQAIDDVRRQLEAMATTQ